LGARELSFSSAPPLKPVLKKRDYQLAFTKLESALSTEVGRKRGREKGNAVQLARYRASGLQRRSMRHSHLELRE